MSVIDSIFANDPTIPDQQEAKTHLYVAGIVVTALLFLVVVKTAMKSAAI